eukprot:CAMPEP_0204406164 /NCGR_PEP_ID=MMETSP0470-20130426/7871_1 /ASSEMBLY_ACC=CAM_ASM_000385 /TAXON_ID=2969 /ORGANISM="Oxyrrhis marina" /LENGTH=68 /DNA_ID=CAMNT_0051401693 /DNA_START=41 /DNA_END=244 /DNA_ORIENTATION=-
MTASFVSLSQLPKARPRAIPVSSPTAVSCKQQSRSCNSRRLSPAASACPPRSVNFVPFNITASFVSLS